LDRPRRRGQPDISSRDSHLLDELKDLRMLTTDLELQISTLKTENRHLQRSQVDLESQRQLNEELQQQLDDLRSRFEDEQTLPAPAVVGGVVAVQSHVCVVEIELD
jgi:uncharacterized protein YigA (DUF484 family)